MTNVSVPSTKPSNQIRILTLALAYSPNIVLHGFFVGGDFRRDERQIYEFGGIDVYRKLSACPLILEKYPDQDIIVQDRWIGLPLKYYLNRKVNYFKNEKLDTSGQSIFVCRPCKRDKIKRIELDYSLLQTQDINWWRENCWEEKRENFYFTIKIHFLRRLQ